MNNLFTRAISGVIYIALIICSLLANPLWFTALVAVFAVLAVWEFHSLNDKQQPANSLIATLILVLDMSASLVLVASTITGFEFLVLGVTIILFYMMLRVIVSLYDKRPEAMSSVMQSLMSLLYIGLPMACASLLNHFSVIPDSKFNLVMLMFVMIWFNDTGAYCVGCTLGKHKLFPRLSPKKSWEGFFGGLVFSAGVGVAYGLSIGKAHDLIVWIGMGLLVSIMATWGDLFESLIKRTVGVKDSGKIMPGHGGILDRIDSLLLVAPATLLYTYIMNLI